MKRGESGELSGEEEYAEKVSSLAAKLSKEEERSYYHHCPQKKGGPFTPVRLLFLGLRVIPSLLHSKRPLSLLSFTPPPLLLLFRLTVVCLQGSSPLLFGSLNSITTTYTTTIIARPTALMHRGGGDFGGAKGVANGIGNANANANGPSRLRRLLKDKGRDKEETEEEEEGGGGHGRGGRGGGRFNLSRFLDDPSPSSHDQVFTEGCALVSCEVRWLLFYRSWVCLC